MSRLVFALVLAVSIAQAPAVAATGEKVVLKAATEASARPPAGRRSFTLELANLSSKQIAIAKPMFPSAWVVKRRYWDGATWQIKENIGGAGQGHPSAGYPNRYRREDYLILRPSEVHRITDDFNWYLAFPGSEVLPRELRGDVLLPIRTLA